jgi:uncharacterized protein (TIGR02270 family)
MIVRSVVNLHIEEAAFLWHVRDAAVQASRFTLGELASVDARLDANVDGVRIAGEAAVDLLDETLHTPQPGHVFTAAIMAFESNDWDRVLRIIDTAAPTFELTRAIISALGWLSAEAAQPHLVRLISAESPLLQRIGLAGLAVHRLDPGAPLRHALEDRQHLMLRIRALRGAAEIGLTELLPLVRASLTDADAQCRFNAAWAAALLGDREAISTLSEFAALGGPYAEEACQVGLRLLEPDEADRVFTDTSTRPGLERVAVVAAGVAGDPVRANWLLGRMGNRGLARIAGEAFRMITGADIDGPRARRRSPWLDVSPPPTRPWEPLEGDLDRWLPWPDVLALRRWWEDYRGEFQEGTRYLLGNPITSGWLNRILLDGEQRDRRLAAYELKRLHPSEPLFEVRAPGWRQMAALQ